MSNVILNLVVQEIERLVASGETEKVIEAFASYIETAGAAPLANAWREAYSFVTGKVNSNPVVTKTG